MRMLCYTAGSRNQGTTDHIFSRRYVCFRTGKEIDSHGNIILCYTYHMDQNLEPDLLESTMKQSRLEKDELHKMFIA